MKIKYLIALLILLLGMGTASAKVEDVALVITGDFTNETNMTGFKLSTNIGYSPIYTLTNDNSLVHGKVNYVPTSLSTIISIPVNVSKFNAGLIIDIDGQQWISVNMTKSYPTYNLTFKYEVGTSNVDSLNNLTKDELTIIIADSIKASSKVNNNTDIIEAVKQTNSQFSSTFIQYFTQQYEPKDEELKAKDKIINELKLQNNELVTKLNTSALTQSFIQKELDETKASNTNLTYAFVIVAAVICLIMGFKSGVFDRIMKR